MDPVPVPGLMPVPEPVPLVEPVPLPALPLPPVPLVCANTNVAAMQSTAKVRINIFVEVRYIGGLLISLV
jgi:hypothetical protein